MNAKAAAFFLVPAIAAGLLASPLRGHIDDTDAQLYAVLARNMAARKAWLEPGPAPSEVGPFREHLPFGLWPFVAATRALGEGAQPFCALAFSLGTVALTLWLGQRLASLRAGIAAALLLACTETFFLYGARPRLDPLLVLLSLCAAAPALLGASPAWAALFGAGAVLVKGPFGLVPLFGAGVARALLERSPRELLRWSSVLALVALLPLAGLLWDRAHGGSWWQGYLHSQLFASATGRRPDGETSALFPLRTIAGRCWPALPFVLLGVAQALPLRLPRALQPAPRARASLNLLALACALGLGALALPQRKVWNHALVLYPLLALMGGVALEALLQRLPERGFRIALPLLAVLAWAGFALGLGPFLLRPPCVLSREFRPQLASLLPGTPILLVSAGPEWTTLVGLEEEHRLSPWTAAALPAAAATEEPGRAGERSRARWALARHLDGPAPAPWSAVAQARGWILLRR